VACLVGPDPRWHGPGLGRAKGRSGRPMAPRRPPSRFRLRFGKILTSTFVSSNSENISCTTFLKYKNNRKQGTDTMASS
jgi:hypothetical protein